MSPGYSLNIFRICVLLLCTHAKDKHVRLNVKYLVKMIKCKEKRLLSSNFKKCCYLTFLFFYYVEIYVYI